MPSNIYLYATDAALIARLPARFAATLRRRAASPYPRRRWKVIRPMNRESRIAGKGFTCSDFSHGSGGGTYPAPEYAPTSNSNPSPPCSLP